VLACTFSYAELLSWLFTDNILWVEELGVEQLVPRVLQAGEAPVDAVGVALGVGQLLGRERAPLLLVDGGVRVLTVPPQLRDVEER
jgi:hypothetical protein